MRFENTPHSLSSLIPDTLRRLDMESKIKEQSCLVLWDEVVGDRIAGAAQPEFIRDGKIFVTTKSPVWANELSFYKKDIVERMNKRVGGTVIKDIIFKAGRIRKKQKPAIREDRTKPDIEGIKLTREELQKVEQMVKVSPAELSDAVRKLMETSFKLDKWKKKNGWKPCTSCGVLQNSGSGLCPPCDIEDKAT